MIQETMHQNITTHPEMRLFRYKRRRFLATTVMMIAAAALVMSGCSLPPPSKAEAADATTTHPEIHPFHINIPQAALVDLRQRLAATRWPDQETVADRSQGAQLAKLQELVRHWGSGYNWRKVEAKLNALPQFTTNIDGLDIHFIHDARHSPSPQVWNGEHTSYPPPLIVASAAT